LRGCIKNPSVGCGCGILGIAERAEVAPDVAEPEDTVTGEPNALPSIENCTVPVGTDWVMELFVAAIVAVKLTGEPVVEGFTLELTVVVVLASQMLEFTKLNALTVPRPVAISQPGAAGYAGS
jgi:hypothetical protein